MYWKDTWSFSDSNEIEIKYAGKYGAKGEKRTPKHKATPYQILKQNQINKEKRMRRLIKANFQKNDYWLTLKYPKGTRKEIKEVKKDIRNFIISMRRQYAKHQEEFKFIYRVEIGRQGGVHIHMIIPHIRGADVQNSWKHGRVNIQLLDGGNYKELAAYITKPPDECVDKQISLFPKEERKEFIKYSSSRNLIRPEPTRKVYTKWTVKKILEEGIEPTKGYIVDKDSIYIGFNPYTGMNYIHYTEYRSKGGGSSG